MTRPLLLAWALAALVSCKTTSQTAPSAETAIQRVLAKVTPCPHEAELAALNKLYPTLGHIDQTSTASLDAADKAIGCLRPWAMTVADGCQQDGLLHWIDFYENEVREYRQKLAERITEKERERYNRERREEETRVRNWERQHPFPKMPQCSDAPRGS